MWGVEFPPSTQRASLKVAAAKVFIGKTWTVTRLAGGQRHVLFQHVRFRVPSILGEIVQGSAQSEQGLFSHVKL